MTRVALRNPLAVLVLSIALMVFSAVVTPRMAVDTFPELTPPVLIVGTLASGLGPKDVEKTITWRLEKFIAATPGVDHIKSESRNSLSIIYVWLKWGTDLNAAQSLVQQQVAFAMSSVPKTLGVLPPFVLQYDPSNAPLIQIAVHGGGLTGPQLYDFAVNTVEPIIEGIPGVASASPNGGRERQINVVVDPVRAEARGVTSGEIAAAVDKANALLPSGRFMGAGFEANVYTNAVAPRVSDIGEAVVKIVGGHPVLVRDVATVEDGGTLPTQFVSVDGKPAVYLNVLRIPGGNTVQIVESIREALAHLPELPPGMVVQPIFDQSTFVEGAMKGLGREIVQALFLIAGVILIFLQSGRSVLIAAISVPLSFAVILLVLYATGQSLNAFTLGGLTLAMGPLVDISVVVLESIHRRRLAGEDDATAALRGANLVAGPALAASLCTIAVLLPVVLLTGLAKKLFSPLALTVASAMVAGYFVSMLVTPVACRYLLGHGEPGKLARGLERAVERLAGAYAAALRAALEHRGAVVLAAVVLVVASAYGATRLPSAFFPEIDESMERVYVRLAPGTSLEESTRIFQEIGQALREELPKDEVELVLMNVGAPSKARAKMNSPNAGPHMGFLRVALVPPEKRSHSQREIADKMRGILARRFPGVEFLQAPGGLVASVFSNGYMAPLVVEVRGDNLEELDAQARAVSEVARTVPGVRDIYTTLDLEYPELRLATDRQEAGLVGVTARAAAQTTLEATLGNINAPSVWVDGSNGQSYYVVTAYDRGIVSEADRLREIPIRATASGAVTLGSYGTIERSAGPISIERNHLQRVAHVLMQTEGRDLGSAAADLEARLRQDPRTRDVHFAMAGQVELMRTTFGGLGVALGLAVMVVFMIMTIQFKSLRLPLVMLFTIPVCLVGIVAALLGAREGFSIPALMGILMVIGIAVSNGILLVDHANRAFQEGKDVLEAAVEAGRARFSPIAMTSLATIISLLPTALGLEHGTESNRPLALAVTGGLASSTFLSLFLVPSMFVFLAKRRTEDVLPVE
ncbi:efflux RND transporter permease subunit [Polyangium mundeleinium]|uniref:Efflux RND transporter permease subunit n=1 Tax=Polyangium mundeleinium TaxID=2995306 RepID=A0ABT5EVJ4_9BACT|nr:efflux RND transporter permease subunit [Polyangium mundeleinium]MDC0745850.1 efflux RND transporter permease subunit [Polyangium mundeleinium]